MAVIGDETQVQLALHLVVHAPRVAQVRRPGPHASDERIEVRRRERAPAPGAR